MVFATRRLRAFPSGLTAEHFNGATIGEAIGAIRRAHPALEPLWFTGAGFGFFYRESEILIDVLLSLARQGISAQPDHDSPHALAGERGPPA
jgi:hypothetical protein